MSKLKKNKEMIEKVLLKQYNVTEVMWSDAAHPLATFFIKDHKFTYSVDSTPKAEYTESKTAKMIKVSLMHKAMNWKYISDPSEFTDKFED